MNNRLGSLIDKSKEDPSLLMELTAVYIETAASSKMQQIKKNQQKVAEILTSHKQTSPLATILITVVNGTFNFYSTNYKKGLKDLKEGKNLFKAGMPPDILGTIYWCQGSIYRSLGQIDLAVENLFFAIDKLKKDGLFNITYAYTYYQLGEIHISIDEYESAKFYYEEALTVISKSDNTTANFRINNGLGLCYLHLKEESKSLKYLNNALNIKGISEAEKARGLCDLGTINLKQENYSQAIKLLQESYELRQQHQLEDASSTSLIHLGDAYLQTDNTDKAIELLNHALIITTKFNAISKSLLVYRLLAKAYEQKKNTELALHFFNQYDKLNNEIKAEQKHKIFRLKNNQIELQKQQLQEKNSQLNDTLEELAKVKTSRKSLFFSIGTAITLVILTEAFFDPLIDSYAYNVYLSLGVKIIIALLLKPMESFYERMLLKRAMKLN